MKEGERLHHLQDLHHLQESFRGFQARKVVAGEGGGCVPSGRSEWPDYDLASQVKVLQTSPVVPSLPGNGPLRRLVLVVIAFANIPSQGFLAHMKPPPSRTLK